MKKFLVVSLMLVLLGGFATAQNVGIGLDLTANYDILNYQAYDGENKPGSYRDTLAGGLPIDGTLTFMATTEDGNAGIEVAVDLGWALARTERIWEDRGTAVAWLKPFKNDWLKVTVGAKPVDPSLLGGFLESMPERIFYERINGDKKDWGMVKYDDYIFGMLKEPYGLMLTSRPIPNLFIGANWGTELAFKGSDIGAGTGPTSAIYSTGVTVNTPRFLENYSNTIIGVGYTFENVGTARLQYVGPPYTIDASGDAGAAGWTSAWDWDTVVGYKDYTSMSDVINAVEATMDGSGAYDDALGKFTGPPRNVVQTGFYVDALKSTGIDFDVLASISLGSSFIYNSASTGKKETVTFGSPVEIAAIGAYRSGKFSLNGGIALALPYTVMESTVSSFKTVENDAVEVTFSAEPAYKLTDNLTVIADLALIINPDQKTGLKQGDVYIYHSKDNPEEKAGTPIDLGFSAFIKYTLGPATLKTGVAVIVPNVTGVDFDTATTESWENGVSVRIPLVLNVRL
jgi:hypothetical protein